MKMACMICGVLNDVYIMPALLYVLQCIIWDRIKTVWHYAYLRQISKMARMMRGALDDAYIMSAVKLKDSTLARPTYACRGDAEG